MQKLLEAHNEAGEFLAPSHMEETVIKDVSEVDFDDFPETTASAIPEAGTTIGPYRLLEQIGEGGMGSVWVASQSEPIKRKVAIKLIKAGMDSGQVLARFEAERQALAMMDHPNIARVLDGGMTEQGRPYFAMEYVRGVPLTEYCDNARLSLKERLELFVPICQAVQHAHQKGIIHRDLKPSNILVCLYDGKPVPKVIDFGLAKAMHQSLTEQSIYTAHGMMVGTPLYMSPEQAEHNNLDIDTRTDVYALGVILYELLTGTTPLERAQFKEAAYGEVLRLIKEVEPPKPSTRLSGSESLPSVAAQRSIEPGHLTRSIVGDLDWVVMKALEKERSRRYETANGLAEDIRRHLTDEPVSACPPSTSYRVRKFIKRNKGQVIAASLLFLSLIVGVAGTTWGLFEANRQAGIARDEAGKKEIALQAETAAREDAEQQTRLAEEARKEAEQISEFLTEVFQSPDPTRDGREIKVVELLDGAAKKLETDLADQPDQRTRLQTTLGKTYYALGLSQQAIPLQEQVRDYHLATSGTDHPDTLTAMNDLAVFYGEVGREDAAIQLLEEVLALRRKISGLEHFDTLNAMNNLAASYSYVGRKDEAMKLQEEALAVFREEFGPEHPGTLAALNNLADSYSSLGRWNEAMRLQEEALTYLRKVLGPEHRNTLRVMWNQAYLYHKTGRLDDAIQLQEEVLRLYRKALGPENPETLSVMNALVMFCKTRASELDQNGETEKAIDLWQKASVAKPSDTSRAMKVAALQAWFGQEAEYHATRQRMLAWAADTEDRAAAERVTKLACLRPIEDAETRKALVTLGTSAVETGRGDSGFLPWAHLALGMAEYRNGQYEQAVETLVTATRTASNTNNKAYIGLIEGTAGFYHAMCLFEQGDQDEARTLFTATEAKMTPLPADEKQPLAENADHDNVIHWLAYKEADALVNE